MNFKNYDIVFTKSLQTYSPRSVQIHIERISHEDGVELDIESTGKLLKKFLNLEQVRFKINEMNLPLEVTSAIDQFNKLEEYIQHDVEEFISTLTYFGYNLFIVGRMDLNDAPQDLNPEYDMRTYLIDNFRENTTGVSCVYSGYSILYNIGAVPTAFDYIQIFGLTSEQYNMYELDTVRASYDLMSSRGDLKDFDDTIPIEFITSRGYKYLTIYNQA